jgi:hypothetical protein
MSYEPEMLHSNTPVLDHRYERLLRVYLHAHLHLMQAGQVQHSSWQQERAGCL